jgi:hypothetical protein
MFTFVIVLQFLFLNFLYNMKVTTPARFTAYRLVVPCQKSASTSVGGCLFWNLNGSSFQLGNCSGISSKASCLFDVKFVFRAELSFTFPLFALHSPVPLSMTSITPVTVYGADKLWALCKIVHLLSFSWLAHFETELFWSSRLHFVKFTAHESCKCVSANGCFVLHVL